MNPFIQFLMALMQHARASQQQPGAGGGTHPGAQANYNRMQQITRGRPPVGFGQGRFANMANNEGTPLGMAARNWMLQNFFGTPGGGNNAIPTPGGGGQYDIRFGPASGGAVGMGNQLNSFGYREVDPNAQLNRMDSLFSGEGRTPDSGAGGDWGFGGGSGGGTGQPLLF